MLRVIFRIHPTICQPGNFARHLAGKSYGNPTIEGLQGSQHEFSQSRAEDIVDRAAEEGQWTQEEKKNRVVQGVQGEHGERNGQKAEVEDITAYNHTANVHLHNVTQSNLPEQYSQGNDSQSYATAPMGGNKQQEKYLSGSRQDTHPSRQFSTSAWLRSQSSMPAVDMPVGGHVSPQGVQGFECDQFQLWLENCRRFKFADCADQLQDYQLGRKTLKAIFEEQEKLIQDIAEDYKQGKEADQESNMQGLQGDIDTTSHFRASGTPTFQGSQTQYMSSVEELSQVENPCPQGVQGSDCAHFTVWLKNCSKYGFANCDDQLSDLNSGRKTLQEIFVEQENLIKGAVAQFEAKKQNKRD